MELNNNLTKGKWAEDDNGMPKFFIINEAIIEKLCILGENVEPCFEGAGIAAKFSFDGEFKEVDSLSDTERSDGGFGHTGR